MDTLTFLGNRRGWGLMGVGYEFVLEIATISSKFLLNFYIQCIVLRSVACPLVCLWWSLESQLNPHLAQLDITSLYILRLMENSAAVCDNYQPAPEDRAARKGRMRVGGEVSHRRRERLKWEEDGHMKSLEKKSSFSLVSLVGTPLSLLFLGYLLCGVRGASSWYVSVTPLPLLKTAILGERH